LEIKATSTSYLKRNTDVLFLKCVIPVRSRVLLSVVDDLDSEDFLEYGPAANIFDAVDHLLPSAPTNHLAENDDAAERRQRRLSKATSATLQSPATPRSASRLDSERYEILLRFSNFFFP